MTSRRQCPRGGGCLWNVFTPPPSGNPVSAPVICVKFRANQPLCPPPNQSVPIHLWVCPYHCARNQLDNNSSTTCHLKEHGYDERRDCHLSHFRRYSGRYQGMFQTESLTKFPYRSGGLYADVMACFMSDDVIACGMFRYAINFSV